MEAHELTTEERRRLLWEFENWLLAEQVGTPNDGTPIRVPANYVPSEFIVYQLKSGAIDSFFVVHKDDVPERFQIMIER